MPSVVRIFLAGDVMTGRGIDQILPRPSRPVLHESCVRDARDYVALAEEQSGPIARPVDFTYVWGDALTVLKRAAPDLCIVNLETSVTRSGEHWPDKGIHYRMHPGNIGCLTAAGIDCCVLANNHVLDFGRAGLVETLEALQTAGISTCGAGRSIGEALAPAEFDLGDAGRVLVFGVGAQSSGIPAEWAADGGRPGVNLLPQQAGMAADAVLSAVVPRVRRGDLVVVSIHWGGNFSYEIPRDQRELAHRLVDSGAVDVVHGHSSHHAKGVEIYHGKPIFYGCGDFINDYEGITGHERYRGDLAIAWFVEWDRRSRSVAAIDAVPLRSRAFRLRMAADADVEWLRGMLERESAPFGVRVERRRHDTVRLTTERGRH